MDRKVKKAIIKICPEVKQAFKDGKDAYAFLASKIFNVPYEECCPYDIKNEDGYMRTKCYSRLAFYRRNVAKDYVLFALYPSFDLIKEINLLIREINIRIQEVIALERKDIIKSEYKEEGDASYEVKSSFS